MTDIRIEAGTLLLTDSPRVVSGLLVPYNEPGRTNLGHVKGIKPGAVPVPTDLTGYAANVDHNRERPVAGFETIQDTPTGWFATMRVQESAAGDALLADLARPVELRKRGKLSAEIADIELRDGWITSGRFFGGSFVGAGAFPSAALLASDVVPDVPDPDTEGNTLMSEATPEPVPEPEPAPEETAPESVAAPVFAMVPNPNGALLASRPPVQPVPTAARALATTRNRGSSLQQVSAALAGYFANRDPSALDALAPEDKQTATLFATLTDVKYSAAGSVGVNVQTPQWLDKLWADNPYVQRVVPYFTPGELTSLEVRGWDWNIPPTGGDWAGNKTDVPSPVFSTKPLNTAAKRWAMAHDHAREFLDFPNPGYWESYFQAGTDHFAMWEDDNLLDAAVANATPVASAASPGTWSGDAATVAIVDGALYLIQQGIVPTAAHIAADLYRGLLLQNDNKVIETLELSLNLEAGSLEGFALVPVPSVELDGTTATPIAGKVLVSNRAAIRHLRLPGVPIRVDALDMVKGGVDTGMFGYAADLVVKPKALALVTPPAGTTTTAKASK